MKINEIIVEYKQTEELDEYNLQDLKRHAKKAGAAAAIAAAAHGAFAQGLHYDTTAPPDLQIASAMADVKKGRDDVQSLKQQSVVQQRQSDKKEPTASINQRT